MLCAVRARLRGALPAFKLLCLMCCAVLPAGAWSGGRVCAARRTDGCGCRGHRETGRRAPRVACSVRLPRISRSTVTGLVRLQTTCMGTTCMGTTCMGSDTWSVARAALGRREQRGGVAGEIAVVLAVNGGAWSGCEPVAQRARRIPRLRAGGGPRAPAALEGCNKRTRAR